MILQRAMSPSVPWWATPLCQTWEFTERSAAALNRVLTIRVRPPIPDNDRDHCRW